MASIRDVTLEPGPTSITRPSLDEAVRAIEGLPAPRVSRQGEMSFGFSEPDGTRVEVRLEGSGDAIERIGVHNPEGFESATATHSRRFCVEVADSLSWTLREAESGRALEAEELLDPSRLGRARGPRALRSRLMIVAALIVFPAALLWHLGGRQRDPWFWFLVLGIGLYFGLRAWGLLARRRR